MLLADDQHHPDPMWGRNSEAYSVDPFLTGEYRAHYVAEVDLRSYALQGSYSA